MIKRILGITKLEDFFKNLSDKMGNHWEHTKNLYDLHEENKVRISQLEKDLIRKSAVLTEMMQEVLSRLEGAADRDIREYIIGEPEKGEEISIEILDNDLTILQIMYDNASFDSNSAITTAKIFENVPFTITQRGLRKKLMGLLKKGVIGTVKRGNERHWHIKTGKISDVKKAILAKQESKPNNKETEQ
jgi:hypothetical protein